MKELFFFLGLGFLPVCSLEAQTNMPLTPQAISQWIKTNQPVITEEMAQEIAHNSLNNLSNQIVFLTVKSLEIQTNQQSDFKKLLLQKQSGEITQTQFEARQRAISNDYQLPIAIYNMKINSLKTQQLEISNKFILAKPNKKISN
jgi:hypothetical protein